MNKPPLIQRLKDRVRLRKSQHKQPALQVRSREYQYSPLKEAAEEIRLVKLLPGEFSSDVRVCLETTRLTDNFVPNFEAVSYAWGPQDNPVNIFIEGDSVDSTLTVTQNLGIALPYLRHKSKSRLLWIDAICVNQQDAKERNRQVQRMADIYSQAQMVLLWLGPGSVDSSLALECVRKVSLRVKANWGLQTIIPISDELHWADPDSVLPFNAEEFLAIANLFHRSWFERLWIWQEVCLAKKAVVICGTEVNDWKDIQTMVFCLYRKVVSVLFHQHCVYSHRRLLYNLCKCSGPTPFVELLEATKHSLCSDPRDRIFALLSLLPESEKYLKVTPDYTKTTRHVYYDISVRSIKHKRLNILTIVDSEDLSAGRGSWIPDWSVPRITSSFSNFFAGGSSLPVAILRGNQEMILQVCGIVVSTIEFSEPFDLSEIDSYPGFAIELQRVATKANLKQYIDSNPQFLRELCRVLFSNCFSSQFFPPRSDHPTIEKSESFMSDLVALSSEYQESRELDSLKFLNDGTVLKAPASLCSGRSLFRTKDGHVGLGPKGMKAGDLVTAWLGCALAMILRPNKAGQYLLVGEAYCSRIMDGGAFLGQLPDNIAFMNRYNKELELYDGMFIDRASDEFFLEDPRLDGVPLPAGWRRQESNGQGIPYPTCYVNDETGEDNGSYDPRLTFEELRSRGVNMEIFDIV